MSSGELVETLSMEAGTAITIYRFVKFASDGACDHVGTAEAVADGVSAGAQATVGGMFAMQIFNGGIAKVEAGAAISRGDNVSSDNVGRAKTAAAGPATNILGVALEAATAAGEVIRVLLTGPYRDDEAA